MIENEVSASSNDTASAAIALDDTTLDALVARYWQEDERAIAVPFLQTLSSEELRIVAR